MGDEVGSTGGILRRPAWRAWVVTVMAAVLLSLAATWLLGGYDDFRAAPASSGNTAGCGGGCCGREGK